MRFRATIQRSGKTATGIQVPEEVVAELGSKRPPVRVTIAGYTYRSTVAPMGGRFLLPVSAEVRERAGVAAGDEVDVEVQLDTEPREMPAPPELAALLEREPDAKRAFEKLSYSGKQRLAQPIADAKTAETRQRRIDKAMEQLRQGRG